jgi:hypothetical protein
VTAASATDRKTKKPLRKQGFLKKSLVLQGLTGGRYWTRNTPENAGENANPESRAALALHSAAKDPRLQAIIEAWPDLPDSVRLNIFGVVESALSDGTCVRSRRTFS